MNMQAKIAAASNIEKIRDCIPQLDIEGLEIAYDAMVRMLDAVIAGYHEPRCHEGPQVLREASAAHVLENLAEEMSDIRCFIIQAAERYTPTTAAEHEVRGRLLLKHEALLGASWKEISELCKKLSQDAAA